MGLFRWVTWNLFLAFIPVALAYLIAWMMTRPARRWLLATITIVLGLVWLVFLPNTCYLLTEWRHFLSYVEQRDPYTIWRQTGDPDMLLWLMGISLFFFCYSALGMLAFTLAIRPIDHALRSRGARMWVWAIPFFILVALGVYLGLIWRFNSWDLLHRPGVIWQTAIDALARPRLALVILGFGALLWIAYQALDIWIDGFRLRWTQRWTRSHTITHLSQSELH